MRALRAGELDELTGDDNPGGVLYAGLIEIQIPKFQIPFNPDSEVKGETRVRRKLSVAKAMGLYL
jgi:hypothetical protein